MNQDENIPHCIVTGGAGFIGSHLCDELISCGYVVSCVDSLLTGSKANIAHLLSHPRFRFIAHDITVPFSDSTFQTLVPHAYLYHLASPASPPQYQRYALETLMVNSVGTKYMLDLAQTAGSVFLLTSTSEVYGDPLEHPQKETYFGNVNPVGIRACYDEGKRFAEALTMEYARKKHCSIRIVRIFNTYGPRMQEADGRVVSNFITQALQGEDITIYGTGEQTRSFCFVADMVDGLVRVMETEGIDGDVINLGYPQEHTVRQIADLIISLTHSSSRLRWLEKTSDDPVRRRPDISKAIRLVGWQPKISLAEGLRLTIAFMEKARKDRG